MAGQIGQHDVVPELEGLVASHPLDEPLAALLMRALRAQGKPGRALEVFEATRARLADQLGIDPSAELAELHLELLRAVPPPARGNLPAEVSSFVGRERDVREVRALIANHRLVTLLGPGGNGKTRLSVEVGALVPGEVWRVELAPVTDPAEVPQAVQTALRLRGQVLIGRTTAMPAPSEPLHRLAEALAGREMLLILDNCEHLIGAAAELADVLLRAAPGLRLLTTSREPLGIPGERLHAVEPLALPGGCGFRVGVGISFGTPTARPRRQCDPDRGHGRAGGPDLPGAGRHAAGHRAGRGQVAYAPDRRARRPPGRPVPPAQRRQPDGSPRHQTLRAVVGWSWDLLGEDERRLWRRFAMFSGGADVTAVEQVCDADLDLLGALVDKSLLVLAPDGRYRMLETIREYGLERLAEAGEAESQRMALAGWLLALAADAEPELRGADQLVWLRRLSVEHDNLHAATRAAIDAGDKATATAFVARLGWYWWLRAHRMEGAVLAAEAAGLPGDTGREDLALTHTFAAINGLEGALSMAVVQEHLRLAEVNGAGPDAAHPALRLLQPLAAIFDNPDMEAGFRAVEPLFEDPDLWLRSAAKMIVAHLRLNFGQSGVVAIAEMREALAGFRELGERWGIGFTLSALGDMVAGGGDFVEGSGCSGRRSRWSARSASGRTCRSWRRSWRISSTWPASRTRHGGC
ncbi:ATP-binding protein [Paractinoplanes durhamensis]|uniref:ATP-binding protein n=1 Tax=Paractinoplanes durhamensis TaxID=113563 RepID=UPI00362BE4FB